MKTVLSLPSIAVVFFLAALPLAGQELTITEFLADNNRGLEDEDGNSSDWIELRNGGDTAIDLAGYALTDDPEMLRRSLGTRAARGTSEQSAAGRETSAGKAQDLSGYARAKFVEAVGG